MKISRIAALVAVPAALSLAACGGGSTVSAFNAAGVNAQVRFVNGAPDVPSADFYYYSSGTTQGTTPTVASVAYGETSNFGQQAAVAGNVTIYPAGTTSGDLTGVCPLPQFTNNGIYTVVLAGTGTNHRCIIYQDVAYGTQPQVRFHDASPNAGSATLYYGAAAAPITVGAQVPLLGSATLGENAAASAATYTQVTPSSYTNTGGATAFAYGTISTGSTFTATNTLNAAAVYAPGTTTQPNTAGTVPYTGTFGGPGGVSLFAIDCTVGGTMPAGSSCIGGTALVGVYDTY